MAIIIEDGSVVDGANSFVTTTEFASFLSMRGYTVSVSKEPLLVRAFDLMMMLPWCVDITEAFDVVDSMKKAQCEVAYQISLGFNPSELVDKVVKREKVDVIDVEYADSAEGTSTNPINAIRRVPAAYGLICDLLCIDSEYLLRA